MEAHLVLNGRTQDVNWLKAKLGNKKNIFAADGGYICLKDFIRITKVLGDLDSSNNLKEHQVEYLPDQNFTDFEKSIQWIKDKGFKKLYIYNYDGNEFDHTIANLYTVAKATDIKICGHSQHSSWTIINKEIQIINSKDTTISLIPLLDCKINYSTGLKYELDPSMVVFKQASLRNLILSDDMSLRLDEGKMLVVVSKHLDFLHKPHFAL
jgi:thiamine pyrophosphokinase